MSRRAPSPRRRLRPAPREPSPPKRATRAHAHAHEVEVGDDDTKPEMDADARAEAWADFAADHYEMIEQLPLELHRNSRLLRELDEESLAQQEMLQSKIRGYIAYRLAVARAPAAGVAASAPVPAQKETEGEGVKPVEEKVADASADAAETSADVGEAADTNTHPSLEPPSEPAEPAEPAEKRGEPAEEPAEPAAEVPEAKAGGEEAETQDAPAQPEPEVTEPVSAPALAPATTTAPAVPTETPTSAATPAQSTATPAHAADDSTHVDSDAAEVHAVEDAAELALVDREATDDRGETKPPARVPLMDIAQLVGDLVRNREEKVAIAIGAYNAIDRHIRALDSALSAHESSLLGIGVTPEGESAASVPPEAAPDKNKRGKKKRKSGSVAPALAAPDAPDVPPGIDADPNEPRYCYCNQVSYGEMVGCDNEDCPYEWFHLGCLGLKAAPQGAWLCENCRPGGAQSSERVPGLGLGAGAPAARVPAPAPKKRKR